ncbi:LysR family transcriptional regulator [Paenalcaligenes niemegkensis]|uniref:LysR family transcriptional regulator n=1 Tax=Paenalcaligenes niemegkensis TaxID=2895469 RepID=UPI001EE90324|nr:LysR family transcriptional regulator [Paenalcaligenes niemegkensis]MCQ9617643.1 LysR family transcriptional regulator [Paenalcaligenes niemegkensis]
MEIRQLEAFAAVLTAGSVTAAGRLLDRSQPVVSRQVQELEQELGFTLIHRTRPHVTLTEKGREFYEEVRPILAGLELLDTRAREIARGTCRPLKLATTLSLGTGVVPQVIGLLEQHAPLFQQKLYIDNVSPEQVVQQVNDGTADVGITSLPVDLGSCKLHWSGQAPCVLALPVGHSFAHQDIIDLSDIPDETLISVFAQYRLRHRMATALSRAHKSPDTIRQIETSSSFNVMSMVAAGLGVGVIDPYTACSYVPESVLIKNIKTHIPSMIGVLTHQDRPVHPDAPRLIEALRQFAVERVYRFTIGDDSGLPSTYDPFVSSPGNSSD